MAENHLKKTIEYYDVNANDYYDAKVDIDMSSQYNMFEKRLYAGASILDCGCGSGRDTKYFLEQGYDVTAIDGSEVLCKIASQYADIEIKNKCFQDLDYVNEFDGIWACASLLHVDINELIEVFRLICRAMKDSGILYVSFKYGDFNGNRDGRYYVDMNEDSLDKLVSEIPELTIQEMCVSEDLRSDRKTEKWLNAIIVKHLKKELIANEQNVKVDSQEDVKVLEGEVVIDRNGNKFLKIARSMKNIDYKGALNTVAQYINMANVSKNIEKSVEYVVQIPAKYQAQFESGEYFINKNKTTGIEWPTLMRKTENGQYRFVDDLPIKQQEFVQGNPFQDICNSYHNIVMQQQIQKIADTVADTYESVKMIEIGQQDDRMALIESGKEQILLALTLQDETHKRELLRQGAHDLLLGKEQIGKALQRRVDAFKALPDSEVQLFFSSLAKPGYLDKKDSEVEHIQDCYSMYIEATKMLAATFAYTGELAAVEQTFKKSVAFLESIDFSNVKTIEVSHKDKDFSDWFFNKPVVYVEAEKTPCLEAAKAYDYVQVEVTGEELLEVISDGEERISETESE